MNVTAEHFPEWLANNARQKLSPSAHRVAVVEMMDWLVGPNAAAAVIGRANARGAAAEHQRRTVAEAVTRRALVAA